MRRESQEQNEFALVCQKIKLDVVVASQALRAAIEKEEHKPSKAGERPKRLRTLVEALADRWQAAGRSIAPDVRVEDGNADRGGAFLNLALDLFCQVDKFPATEVEAAVTNVHEKRLAQISSGKK